MPSRIWITNAEQDPGTGGYSPANLPAGTLSVHQLYEKQGNVRKFLVKTPWTVPIQVVTGTSGTDEEGNPIPIYEWQETPHPNAVDLTGLPGVFGPIPPDQIEAALSADNAETFMGWDVSQVPTWALDGVS